MHLSTIARALLVSGGVASLGASGCSAILGIEDLSGTGVAGGAGGSGGSGISCEPGATCYSGPPGTLGVGVCAAGTCGPQGDACEGDTAPYLEDCPADFDENCDGEPACTGEGTASVAAPGPELQQSAFIAVDDAGNVYLAGSFLGSFAFPGGPLLQSAGLEDVFVAKLDRDLTHVWSKSFGDAATQLATGVAADGNGVVVAGTFQGELSLGGSPLDAAASNAGFIASFDPAGSHAWSRKIDGMGDEQIRDVALDGDSDVYVVGHYDTALTIPPFEPLTPAVNVNGLLLKLDASGGPEWVHTFGDDAAAAVTATRVVASADGSEVYVAGVTSGPFVLGGSALVHQGLSDVFVARFAGSRAGDATYAASFGGTGDDLLMDIARDGAGGFLVAAGFLSAVVIGATTATTAPADQQPDALVVKFEPEGDGAAWYEVLAGDGVDFARGIAVDGSGNWVLTGSYEHKIGVWKDASAGDMFIAKYTVDQAGIWYWNIGGDQDEFETGLDVAIDPLGNILVVGAYQNHLGDLVPPVSPADQVGATPGDLFVTKRRP